MKSISTSLIVAGAVASSITSIYAEELGTTTVVGKSPDFLDSIEKTREKIAALPGGASIIEAKEWVGVTKLEEIFQLDPGVYARSNGTANDSRISIRGSGIQRRFGSRGISLLLDGTPANHADGSYYFRIFDPLSISRLETYRGANALPYGGNQLGGAINIVQKNGLTDPGTQLTVEAGSNETYRAALQTGGSSDRWDWFISHSYGESSGYRDHGAWNNHHFTANVGYKWSDDALTRFYFLFSDSDGDLAGRLTPTQFREDSRQSDNVGTPLDRDLSTIRIGQRTAWNTAGGEWEFSTNYQYLDFDHLTTQAGAFFPLFDNLIDFDTDEVSVGFRGNQKYEAFGLDHKFHANVDFTYGENEVGGSSAFGAEAGQIDRKETSRNISVYLQNTTTLAEKHHLIYGVGYVDSLRERDVRSNDLTGATGFRNSQNGVTWRAGYLYERNESNQFFGNVSQSFEAAPFSEVDTNVTNPQEAITFEVGTRFSHSDWLKGELTLYRSNVNEEFVFEETGPDSGLFLVENADTTHQGIEAAVNVNLSRAFDLTGSVDYGFDVVYQLNDFTFDEGEDAGNSIPVISNQVITARLTAASASEKWKTSLSVDWLPDGLVADNANTLTTAGYAVFDLSAEYRISENMSIYGGIKNLFDKEYVSSVTVNPSTAAGEASFISPGDGRSLFFGARISF